MENSVYSSCVSPAATYLSGESSWAMHIANFLASPRNSEEMTGEALSDGSFSSSFASIDGDASFVTSDLMSDDEDDDSLQDTACSAAPPPKDLGMNNVHVEPTINLDEKEMIPQRYFIDAISQQRVVDGVQEVISGDENIEKESYECSELRKKGLCLVPLSMLIDYLG